MRIYASDVVVDVQRRTISGTVFRYGEVGRTSAGPLRVLDRGAIRIPADVTTVPLVMEHDEGVVRGHLLMVDDSPERMYVVAKVADGPLGDEALRDAVTRKRGGFSFGLLDGVVNDDVIVSADLAHMGQVENPAFNSARIDRIAASNPEGNTMKLTPEQQARLTELSAKATLTQEEAAELAQLQALAADDTEVVAEENPAAPATPAAAAPVTASIPTVPAGVRRPITGSAQVRENAFDAFIKKLMGAATAAGPGQAKQAITAALADVTSTAHTGNIEAPAWSGELWSGVQHEQEFVPMLNSGSLTSWEGRGWRWLVKPEMQDYAGDKAAVPTNIPDTEASSYVAARMACGHDLDRKFFDFPNEAFLRSFFEAGRESWSVKTDAKAETYIVTEGLANASGVVPVAGNRLATIAKLLRYIKRQRLGKASFVVLSDADYDALIEYTNDSLPAFLEMFGVDPKNFTSSAQVPTDKVVAGVKQAATFRTLPGSPIRVDAQNIGNGGVDTGLFGYWAIEEHHKTGIVSADFGFVA